MTKATIYAGTHPGVLRDYNEDSVRVWDGLDAWCVLDGMSGSGNTEPAQTMLRDAIDESMVRVPRLSLERVLQHANGALFRTAQEHYSRLRGCGATCVLARLEGDVLTWAHVGDCRLYGLRDGRLEQLTHDHSLLNECLSKGLLTAEQLETFPHKNVVTRALGMKDVLEVDTASRQVHPGDMYLGCSDGLYDMLPDEHILDILTHPDLEPEELVDRLLLEANMAGGEDNIAVVVMAVS